MNVSPVALRELFKPTPAVLDVNLFTITHLDLESPFYLCNDTVDHIVGGITYKATSFVYTPPSVSKNNSSEGTEGQLSISIVDQVLPSALIDLVGYLSITCVGVLILATGEVEKIDDWEFSLQQAQWTPLTLTASLVFETYLDTSVPANTFDSINCPGSWV